MTYPPRDKLQVARDTGCCDVCTIFGNIQQCEYGCRAAADRRNSGEKLSLECNYALPGKCKCLSKKFTLYTVQDFVKAGVSEATKERIATILGISVEELIAEML
jgi:hypothetical protein